MMDSLNPTQYAVALLPDLVLQQWWLSVAWSVVLAWVGVGLLGRFTLQGWAKLGVAVLIAAWVWLPGSWGGTHWLGLAFQAPSLTSALLCAVLLVRRLAQPASSRHTRTLWPFSLLFLALCGVVLGWLLLLDTLGVFAGSLYRWGFGAAAPALAVVVASMAWVLAKPAASSAVTTAVVVTAILLFVATRLPSGSVFDALIDPGLWVVLHIALVQQWRARLQPT